MSPLTIARGFIPAAPAVLAIAVAALVAVLPIDGARDHARQIAIGALWAIPLCALGGVVTALSARGTIAAAALGAASAFVLRIGGAGAIIFAVQPGPTAALTLLACLALGLGVEAAAWMHTARQEPARA